MTKVESERQIIAEMRQRLPYVPYKGASGGLKEYQQLRQERPDLFNFTHGGGDEWQVVAGWLRKHKLVA